MQETADNQGNQADRFSLVLIQLLKGALYRDNHPELWQDLINFQGRARDYFGQIGLQLFIDESEGYAFLRQKQDDPALEGHSSPLPRLIARRPLGYRLSLLCLLLVKRLVEHDATTGEPRLILSREQIIDMAHIFMPQAKSDAGAVDQIDKGVNKLVEYGILRLLKGEDKRYEVRRIIKALAGADWIEDLDRRLREYQAYEEPNS